MWSLTRGNSLRIGRGARARASRAGLPRGFGAATTGLVLRGFRARKPRRAMPKAAKRLPPGPERVAFGPVPPLPPRGRHACSGGSSSVAQGCGRSRRLPSAGALSIGAGNASGGAAKSSLPPISFEHQPLAQNNGGQGPNRPRSPSVGAARGLTRFPTGTSGPLIDAGLYIDHAFIGEREAHTPAVPAQYLLNPSVTVGLGDLR